MQGEIVTIAVVKRMVYRSTYVGPDTSRGLCAALPLSRRCYFWIEYLDCRWPVKQDKGGRYVLDLPGKSILDDLLNAM